MDIKEFRKQYPMYNDMSDAQLSDAIYKKSYSDMDRSEFNKKFGYTTGWQAAWANATKALLPTVASIPAMTFGAEAGSAIGAMTGPAAPVAVPVLGVAGGIAGAIGGSTLMNKAQDYLLSKAPSVANALGIDDKTMQLAREQHPTASLAGELGAQALLFRPSPTALKQAFTSTKDLTPVQRAIVNSERINVAGGATIGAGMEGYNQYKQGEFNPTNMLLATAGGALLNKSGRTAQVIESTTTRAFERMTGTSTAKSNRALIQEEEAKVAEMNAQAEAIAKQRELEAQQYEAQQAQEKVAQEAQAERQKQSEQMTQNYKNMREQDKVDAQNDLTDTVHSIFNEKQDNIGERPTKLADEPMPDTAMPKEEPKSYTDMTPEEQFKEVGSLVRTMNEREDAIREVNPKAKDSEINSEFERDFGHLPQFKDAMDIKSSSKEPEFKTINKPEPIKTTEGLSTLQKLQELSAHPEFDTHLSERENIKSSDIKSMKTKEADRAWNQGELVGGGQYSTNYNSRFGLLGTEAKAIKQALATGKVGSIAEKALPKLEADLNARVAENAPDYHAMQQEAMQSVEANRAFEPEHKTQLKEAVAYNRLKTANPSTVSGQMAIKDATATLRAIDEARKQEVGSMIGSKEQADKLYNSIDDVSTKIQNINC